MPINKEYDLIGIGLGPFNLSLAALLSKHRDLNIKFCEMKKEMNWHPELIFDDAPMQSSFLKDLVTPVDPTNPYSFLNYLVKKNQFYHFLNTSRSSITRYEFQNYLQWVATELNDIIDYSSQIENIHFKDGSFHVFKKSTSYQCKNICVASGPQKNIPACVKEHLGKEVFHAKDPAVKNLNIEGRNLVIVGGGQTGVECFRNALNAKWGKAKSIELITGRENLLPLDEGPFTNEIFTPEFVSNFHSLDQAKKDKFTKRLLLASDGNTPTYLQDLYNELYLDRFYKKSFSPYKISPMSWLVDMNKEGSGYSLEVEHRLSGHIESVDADIVILATGFRNELPKFLMGLGDYIHRDSFGRPIVSLDYRLKSDLDKNHIFVMNYSRHMHGIADPQTSLMSWRSAVIANSLLGKEVFPSGTTENSFLQYFSN